MLSTAGIENPRAFVVTYTDPELCFKSVERLREAFPSTPILTRASDMGEYFHLLEAGATKAVPDERESSLVMASLLLENLGVREPEIVKMQADIRKNFEVEDNEKLELKASMKKNLAMTAIKDNDLKYTDRVISRASNFMQDIFGSTRKIYDDNTIFIKDDNNKNSETNIDDISDDIDELGVKVCPIPTRKNPSIE